MSACWLRSEFAAVAVALVAVGCSAHGQHGAAPARLRVKNVGTVPIAGLVVLFETDVVEFGDVAAGATTPYAVAPHGVFSYAAYRCIVDGKERTQRVIDFIGEHPMPGSAFTYVIDFDAARGDSPIRLVSTARDE